MFGGILLRLDWEPLRGRGLDHGSGQTRMPPQERRHEDVFDLGGFFCGWTGSRCGSMCWPRERPATHAAAGAAARGVRGRLKVARGRSWQPEIGMEHASRGRRSGNKGVGARWRGRFRIFSARHCSRTKVSHAENSGMTMLFFSWGLLRCRACVDHRSGHAAPCHHGSGWHEGGWFLFFFGDCSGVGGMLTTGVVMRRRATTGVDGTRGVGFCFFLWRLLRCRRGILSQAREWTARGLMRFKTAKFYGPLHRVFSKQQNRVKSPLCESLSSTRTQAPA